MKFESTMKFLASLARNNNREWFEKNKERYLGHKQEFEEFVGLLLHELIKFDSTLTGLEPKKLIFRIYRDVRFSKDKTPYKTNMGASFSSTGKGMGAPGYYFQIQPGGESFVAAGMFMPTPERVAQIRQEIDYNGDRLGKIFKEAKFRKYYTGFWEEDRLKSAPKGYDKEHLYIDWLRLKSFVVTHNFTDKDVLDNKVLKNVVEVMKAAHPVNEFLRDAIATEAG